MKSVSLVRNQPIWRFSNFLLELNDKKGF